MRLRVTPVVRWLGSLTVAVPLLIALAVVLAWGTLYETRFSTASVQRFIYHAWWFQALLGFLAVNLAIAAAERYPWKRRHVPFVLAHLGIICILLGGIIGGRFGIEGQLVIPEGQAERVMELPGNVLVVRQPNPGAHAVIPTRFETQAWVHEPNTTFPLRLHDRAIELTVDRYYPDAVMEEVVRDGGEADNPAVQVRLSHGEQTDTMWLLARDPKRFGVGWGEAHVLVMEPRTATQLNQVLGRSGEAQAPRGIVSVRLPGLEASHEMPVPVELNQRVDIPGSPYHLLFKDYFPDFAITDQGLVSRSMEPRNPAVSFTLNGPEGRDAYLLFALHPDFQTLHGVTHRIPAEVQYVHTVARGLPPNTIAVVRHGAERWLAVLTDGALERTVLDPIVVGRRYEHPSLGYTFELVAAYDRAIVESRVTNRGDTVKREALHVVAREGAVTAEGWVTSQDSARFALGDDPLLIEYRSDRRELPVTIKLLDFRKIDYPGTQMAAGFESDVQLSDSRRGLILVRTINMNNPLRYRGHSFYQSSFIEGPHQMTVLSVRNDPGTPLVYAGFLVVIGGVISMFAMRNGAARGTARRPGRKRQPRHRRASA